MDFRYDPQKAVQAASRFLEIHGGRMEYMKLLKLLYMADRQALKQMGESITGDKYVSMNYGPVLSGIYDRINHGPKHHPGDPWFDHITPPRDYHVELQGDGPGIDDLCEEETDIISDIFERYGKTNVWDLSDLSHRFPEWQYPNGSAIPIRIADILRGMGMAEAEIQEILAEIEAGKYLDKLLENEPLEAELMQC